MAAEDRRAGSANLTSVHFTFFLFPKTPFSPHSLFLTFSFRIQSIWQDTYQANCTESVPLVPFWAFQQERGIEDKWFNHLEVAPRNPNQTADDQLEGFTHYQVRTLDSSDSVAHPDISGTRHSPPLSLITLGRIQNHVHKDASVMHLGLISAAQCASRLEKEIDICLAGILCYKELCQVFMATGCSGMEKPLASLPATPETLDPVQHRVPDINKLSFATLIASGFLHSLCESQRSLRTAAGLGMNGCSPHSCHYDDDAPFWMVTSGGSLRLW
ncbi:High-affinity nicotinic acid transporter [Clarias magur]|uniref:High-affinity nicotinic acid transporter n=1 Tax=Clarias magur TaxID=1594786 RepID=A0A8J4U5M0_CLAMG|nr:High-affinity nicotinic acid transporter [Clarias magur]